MNKGLFITFEGGEGSGKSTQAKLLHDYLINHKVTYDDAVYCNIISHKITDCNMNNCNVSKYDMTNCDTTDHNVNNYYVNNNTVNYSTNHDVIDHDVILTREPGGTVLAEKLRELVVKNNKEDLHPITESLIFLAARSDNLIHNILPAINKGKTVICDRFQDSTLVYQGICQNVDLNLLNNIYSSINGAIYPDITYILDIDPEIGLQRSLSHNNSETRFEQKNLEYHQKVREGYLQLSKTNSRYYVLNALEDIQILHQQIIDHLLKTIRHK